MAAANIPRRHPSFLLLQDRDDLLLAEPAPLHSVRLLGGGLYSLAVTFQGSTSDRIVATSNDAVVAAYERRIDELEQEKLVLAERCANAGKPVRAFGEMFELALTFLAKPLNLWKSNHLEDKQTVIKLVFGAGSHMAGIADFEPHKCQQFSAL